MAIDSAVPRTRRALLAAALGAAVAGVASAVGRPAPASAADGDYVRVGRAHTSSTVTRISNTTGAGHGIFGVAKGGVGVSGESDTSTGVFGTSGSYRGVFGFSSASYGVYGEGGLGGVHGWSDAGPGVHGKSAGGSGVIGHAQGSTTGVFGYSGQYDPPAAPAKTGVYGYATQDADSRGVHGKTVAGRGVYGEATSGQGVRGYATSGTAGYFAMGDVTAGYALRAIGRVRFDKCAGVVTIPAGSKSTTVTPGIALATTSAVVATLQGNAGSEATTVSRVFVNASTDKFTIYLTADATQDVKVAWIVIG